MVAVETQLPDTQPWVDKLQEMANVAAEMIEPSNFDIENQKLFDAEAGYSNASHTAIAADNDDEARRIRERQLTNRHASAAGQMAREFVDNINSAIDNRISVLRDNVADLDEQIAGDQEQLVVEEGQLVVANEEVDERTAIADSERVESIVAGAEAAIETAEAEQAEAVLEELEASNLSLREQWQAAMDARDMELANRLAVGGAYTSERVSTGRATAERESTEAFVATIEAAIEESEADTAAEARDEAIVERDGIQNTINDLRERIGDNRELRSGFMDEIDGLENLQNYVTDNDIEGRITRGEITREEAMEELRANGMSEEMAARLEGQELTGQNISNASVGQLASIGNDIDNDEVRIASASRDGMPAVESDIGEGLSATGEFQLASSGIQSTVPTPAAVPQPVGAQVQAQSLTT